jgi:hypothetical protein
LDPSNPTISIENEAASTLTVDEENLAISSYNEYKNNPIITTFYFNGTHWTPGIL